MGYKNKPIHRNTMQPASIEDTTRKTQEGIDRERERIKERLRCQTDNESGKLRSNSDRFRVESPNAIGWNILESTKIRHWGVPLLYNMLKEFVAVMAFFMCNSRIGASDPNATPLILFGTLVVFAFPHMNPYLFTFMRTGPWLSRQLSCGYVFTVLMQIIGMTTAQCTGAIAAAAFRHRLSQTFGSESVITSTGYVSLRLNKKCVNDNINTTTTISLFPPYFTEQIDTMGKAFCFNDLDNISRIWWTFEELFGVAAFLIGTIHIMETLMPGLLINTFWSKPMPQKEYKVSTTTEVAGELHVVSSINKDDSIIDLNDTNPLSPSNETTEEKSPYVGIPIQFIAVESMFFAAAQKAFPTSHLALHVTAYLAVLEHLDTENEGIYLHKSETPFRILGGVLGTFIAWLYYLFVQKHPDLFPGFITFVTGTDFFKSRAPAAEFNNTPNLAITFRKNFNNNNFQDDIKLNVKHLH